MVMHSKGELLANLFSTDAMEYIFSDARQVQQMLRFEWALSAALEDCGIASSGSASPLAALLETEFLTPDRAESLEVGAATAGNLAIPFIKLLTAVVTEHNAEAASFIHTGATSQDVLDTALVLQMREALAHVYAEVEAILNRCKTLAREHAETILPGRTWLQQGPPVTLGLKFAGYAAAVARSKDRLHQAASHAIVLQFGGAVGTLASLHRDGLKVSAALARHLQIPEPTIPWHSHRDNLVEVATTLGILVGTLGKIARDISLSMQTEIGELFEPASEGRGGSSTMPHKRNPVGCAVVLAAAVRVPHLVATMLAAMPQEQERGLGGWHAEWETLPEIFRLAAGALAQIRNILYGIEVHPERMAANLELTRGLLLAESISVALADHIGRLAAYQLVEKASRRAIEGHLTLEAVMSEIPEVKQHLTPAHLHQLFQYRDYLGSTQQLIERTLESLERAKD